tara:strand:+ start:93 stop:299 length:207 start_codon:yes stop_codon:yes gene_type:complete
MKPKKFDNLRAFGMHRLYELKANPQATKEYEIAVNTLCRVLGNPDKFDVLLWQNHQSILEKSGFGITE